MKRRFSILGIFALVVSLPITAAAASSPSPQPAAEKQPAVEARTIGVDVLLGSPDSHKGMVRVRGVVISVFPKEQRLGLIDAIYLGCCSSPCASLPALPVKWTGDMPPVRSLVMVTGEIQRAGEKLEFVARSIERSETTAGTGK